MPISAGQDNQGTASLAVVIPTLNEEKSLPGLLASLQKQSMPAECIIVADGGSTDSTISEARQGGANVVLAPGRGRGGQIAAAMAQVTEEIVFVAHADMILPPLALEAVRRSLAETPRCPGGCLGHRFDQASLVLRAVEWWDRQRARRGTSYGDQAQFFRRELLRTANGFPDQPIMEDVELSRRLRSLGVPLYLDLPVTVSARRFKSMSWWQVVWINGRLCRRYQREGLAACAELYEQYYRTRVRSEKENRREPVG
jgi:glycosyltransferase involved in cell wall biosynthesis